jgi:hypothetical protein
LSSKSYLLYDFIHKHTGFTCFAVGRHGAVSTGEETRKDGREGRKEWKEGMEEGRKGREECKEGKRKERKESKEGRQAQNTKNPGILRHQKRR